MRENFQKVFQALFTEDDTADMVLVDPENLAETGIDIVAKPKGKRPSSEQTIEQITGTSELSWRNDVSAILISSKSRKVSRKTASTSASSSAFS